MCQCDCGTAVETYCGGPRLLWSRKGSYQSTLGLGMRLPIREDPIEHTSQRIAMQGTCCNLRGSQKQTGCYPLPIPLMSSTQHPTPASQHSIVSVIRPSCCLYCWYISSTAYLTSDRMKVFLTTPQCPQNNFGINGRYIRVDY